MASEPRGSQLLPMRVCGSILPPPSGLPAWPVFGWGAADAAALIRLVQAAAAARADAAVLAADGTTDPAGGAGRDDLTGGTPSEPPPNTPRPGPLTQQAIEMIGSTAAAAVACAGLRSTSRRPSGAPAAVADGAIGDHVVAVSAAAAAAAAAGEAPPGGEAAAAPAAETASSAAAAAEETAARLQG